MVLENIINDDVCQCTSLFKNAFKIKSTPETLRSSRTRRNLGMATSPCIFEQDENARGRGKENGTTISSPIHCNASPKMTSHSRPQLRCPLDDFDANSQDSGFGNLSEKEDKPRIRFQFTEPLGVAPKRLSMDPFSSPARASGSPTLLSPVRPSHYRTLSSGYESTDDGFNELIDMETLDDCAVPSGLSSLISGEIVNADKAMECDVTTPEMPQKARHRKVRSMRRSLSFQVERQENTPSNVRSCLFRSPNSTCSTSKLSFERSRLMEIGASPELRDTFKRSFKRPEPPSDGSPVLVKKVKVANLPLQEEQMKTPEPKKKVMSRCLSENDRHDHIKQALHRSQHFDDLTGDFSKSCVLPLAEGRHHDLKSISPVTLAGLIEGRFQDQVGGFHIIDCRYPYEYEGGHIVGAVNLYTTEMIEQFLIQPVETQKPEITPDSKKRRILVFHCEFSFERGPNMSRFLRHIDRKRNHDCYPALHYPEVYLLDGGYESFFKDFSQMCTPHGYRKMEDPKHEEDLKQFRNKSKSWQSEKPSRAININKHNLKRLGF